MAEEIKISVEMVEEDDCNGDLRFSEKKYHHHLTNADFDDAETECGPEELKNYRDAETLDSEDGDIATHEYTELPEVGGYPEKGSGDALIEDVCPDLSDETDWFSIMKGKQLGELCIKDFDNIVFDSVDDAEKF